jgi:hypothetical protein
VPTRIEQLRQQYPRVHWLSDEDYEKAKGQLTTQLNGVFSPFCKYGLDVLVPGAMEEVVRLCEDFGLRVRGIDHPIHLDKSVNFKED